MSEQQLYTREVSAKGKVTYRPVQQVEGKPVDIEMDNIEICSVAATIATATLAVLQDNLPQHALVARKLKNLEKAIVDIANTSNKQLSQKAFEAAYMAWKASIDTFAREMMKG